MSELDDAPLTAEEILTFGPCVEAQVWTPIWLQESRAPIAVAAGRPKFGPVFNADGIGKMAVIRPCVSRGRRVRGLPPIYTPQMLEANAGVFNGWPMFTDHVPPQVAETLAKRGRSVRELGGQVVRGWWGRDFVHEDDGQYGYQKGAILAETWATPLIRQTVGNNPGLLHVSINAWPTSGKPGQVPWRPAVKGMLIEGIRSQPQGSVDYVVRGGAGGRLLVAEGLEDEGAWPEVGEWSEDDTRLVVSLAESLYASPRMTPLTLPQNPSELQAWLEENAPHLLPALREADDNDADDTKPPASKRKRRTETKPEDAMSEGLTAEQVREIIQESLSGMPSADEFERRLQERTEETIREREQLRLLSERACRLIEGASGIPLKWKADLKARYSLLPSGAPSTLLVESEQDDTGATLSPQQVLERNVHADLDHVRDLVAEAQGRPRVRGEGGREAAGGKGARREVPHWRREFARIGLAESADKAMEAFGAKVEG